MQSGKAASPQATPDKPWLGLAHFTAIDRPFFFGRKAEIRELTDRVHRAPLTVLYGVSGYGKSSLIGAGLLPELAEAGHQHVTLLRRCYDDLSERSLVDDVIAAASVSGAFPPRVVTEVTETQPKNDPVTLWQFYHDRAQPWLQPADEGGLPAPPVLILDQFEEIFTKGEDRDTTDKAADARARQHAREFLAQLADLVENRPPAAVRDVLDSGSAEEKRALLRQYDFQARPVRVLLALREDFLARLERQRRAMPSMMEHRIELRLLAGPQAYEAVFRPGTMRDGKPPIIPLGIAEAIVCAASGVPSGTDLVEIDAVPPILSLLCERLNAARKADSIAPEDFDASKARRILEDFYEGKLKTHPRSLREFLEKWLTSDAGLREAATLATALNRLRHIPDAEARLRQLVDDRILVIEDRHGVARVEFTHDTLSRIALDSRTARDTRRRRLRALIWTCAALLIAGGSTALALWALKEQAEAKKQTAFAQAQTKLALAREQDADRAREQAAQAQKATEMALQVVKDEKVRSEQAYKDANTQKDKALAARSQAEDILQYLIGDLRQNMQGKAQLSILMDVEKQVDAYYEKLGVDMDDPQQLKRRSWALQNQGETLMASGDLEGAASAIEQSLALRAQRNDLQSDGLAALRAYSSSFNCLGIIKQLQKDFPGAAQAHQQSIEIKIKLAQHYPENTSLQSDLAVGYRNRGRIKEALKDSRGAAQDYQESLEIMLKITPSDPENILWQEILAVIYDSLGRIKQAQGDMPGAEQAYQQYNATMLKLTQRDPDNMDWQRDLSVSYNNLGTIKQERGDIAGAKEAYQQYNATMLKLTQRDPDNMDWQRDLSVSYNNLGSIKQTQHDEKGAGKVFQQALDICLKQAMNHPSNAQWQNDLLASFNNLGFNKLAQGNVAGAAEALKQALDICLKRAKSNPSNAQWQRELYSAYESLAITRAKQKDWAAAADLVSKALVIAEALQKAKQLNAEDDGVMARLHSALQDMRAHMKQ